MTATKFKVESGFQLLARLTKKVEIENFYPTLFDNGVKHGEVIEICSNECTSYLLTDMICEALLPNKSNKEAVGVLMFNTSGRFVYENFIKTLEKRILSNFKNDPNCKVPETDVNNTLHKALSNFFLLEIYDATQLYITIHKLDNIFMKHQNISLLIFDTLTAFYWSEQGFKITQMNFYIKNLLRMIQKVSKEYNVIIVYTRPGYFNSSKDLENFETSEVTDGVHFKVQLTDKGKEVYEVNVKTVDAYYKKCFSIIDKLTIKWQ